MLRVPITFVAPRRSGNISPEAWPVAGSGLPSGTQRSDYGGNVAAITPNASVRPLHDPRLINHGNSTTVALLASRQPGATSAANDTARLRSPFADPAVAELLAGAGVLAGGAAMRIGAKSLWRGAMEFDALKPRWRRTPVMPVSPEQLIARPHITFSATQLLADPKAAARVSEAMWRDGRLMDYYLSLYTTGEQYAEALPELIRIESAWLDFFKRHCTAVLAVKKRAVLAWMGGDAGTVKRLLDELTASDIATLHTCLLMRDFLYGQTPLERRRVAQSFRFHDNADALTLVHGAAYDCNSISTLILHLWRLLPADAGITALKSFTMPEHTSLLIPLSGEQVVMFNNGQELLIGIKTDAAEVMLHEPGTYDAIAREPWQIMAGNLVDLAYTLTVGSGKHDAAAVGALVGVCGAALAIDPDEHNANYMLGRLFLALNNHSEARFYAARALQFYRDNWKSHLLLAQSYLDIGDLARAAEHLAHAERTAPDMHSVKDLRQALEGKKPDSAN